MQIGVRDKRFPASAWLRRCQECGNVQAMKSPEGQKTDNWREAKCRNCKSEGSLDYGTPNEYVSDDEEPIKKVDFDPSSIKWTAANEEQAEGRFKR